MTENKKTMENRFMVESKNRYGQKLQEWQTMTEKKKQFLIDL